MNSSVELESSPCPMGCGKGDAVVLLAHDRIQHLPGQYTIVRCLGCGLMRTNPRPTPNSIGFYYPDTYGPYLGTQVKQSDASLGERSTWQLCKDALKGWLNRHMDLRTQSIPALPPGRMLEVGCASGAYLHKMAGLGWTVDGIELSENAATQVEQLGYAVHAGSIESAPDRHSEYDLIVAWMVLEHLHNPLAALQLMARWAKPDATLVLSVPNIEAVGFRLFGARWHALHIPNHLFHFSAQTAEALLERSGWKICRISHHRVLANFTGSLSQVLHDWGFKHTGRLMGRFATYQNGILNYAFFPIAWLLGIAKQTGEFTIWARKI